MLDLAQRNNSCKTAIMDLDAILVETFKDEALSCCKGRLARQYFLR